MEEEPQQEPASQKQPQDQSEDQAPREEDEFGPPLHDDDAPPPSDEEFVNIEELMQMDQSPVINDADQNLSPRRRSDAPFPAQPGQRPFPPSLEPKRWYRMLLDEANRPIAIIDHARDKAVHTYATPPDRLSFKIDLSSVVQGASASFRAPLPVGEMGDRLEGKKFCFECQPGADGEEVVMKIMPAQAPADGKTPKEEILKGKPPFKGPKGQAPLSSFPALSSGHSSAPPMSAPAVPGKDLGSQMLWLQSYQARQRGKRV
jgi:hypothetical protein